LAIVLSLNSLGYCSGYFENGKKLLIQATIKVPAQVFLYALKEDPYDVNARYYYAIALQEWDNTARLYLNLNRLSKLIHILSCNHVKNSPFKN
jgi:hypothetical protein